MASRRPSLKIFADGMWRDMALSLALAVGLAAVCHAAVAEARFIPSGSMLPTLKVGDRVLIEKISYHARQPRRGDIVVFRPPPAVEAFGYDNHIPWIKRVIALPGERVGVREGKVWIDDAPLDERYLDEPPFYAMTERIVPAGHVFVLGDNRNHSIDSHVWGTVPMGNIIGRASFRFWPLGHFGDLVPQQASVKAARWHASE